MSAWYRNSRFAYWSRSLYPSSQEKIFAVRECFWATESEAHLLSENNNYLTLANAAYVIESTTAWARLCDAETVSASSRRCYEVEAFVRIFAADSKWVYSIFVFQFAVALRHRWGLTELQFVADRYLASHHSTSPQHQYIYMIQIMTPHDRRSVFSLDRKNNNKFTD